MRRIKDAKESTLKNVHYIAASSYSLLSLNHKTIFVGFTAIHLERWKFKNLGMKKFKILKYLCPVLASVWAR
jgi:hypothetical protein